MQVLYTCTKFWISTCSDHGLLIYTPCQQLNSFFFQIAKFILGYLQNIKHKYTIGQVGKVLFCEKKSISVTLPGKVVVTSVIIAMC